MSVILSLSVKIGITKINHISDCPARLKEELELHEEDVRKILENMVQRKLPQIPLSSIIGMKEAKSELNRAIINPLRMGSLTSEEGGRTIGILLMGPPGRFTFTCQLIAYVPSCGQR